MPACLSKAASLSSMLSTPRYQLWRKEVLNQRRFARRFARFVWIAMIPMAAGLAVYRADTSPRELVRNLKDRWPRHPFKHLRPASPAQADAEEEEAEEEQDLGAAEPLVEQPRSHNKKFFWF